jgi:hypothetical protein
MNSHGGMLSGGGMSRSPPPRVRRRDGTAGEALIAMKRAIAMATRKKKLAGNAKEEEGSL